MMVIINIIEEWGLQFKERLNLIPNTVLSSDPEQNSFYLKQQEEEN